MSDYGIKVAKPGFDAKQPLTERNKKDFSAINTADSHKIIFAGYVTGGTYTHNLNYVPDFTAFRVDAIPATTFTPTIDPRATSSIINFLPTNCYLIVYNEGNK